MEINKKDRFKLKGQSILNDSTPNSMKDFLEDQKDTQMHKDAIAQLPKTTKPQKLNPTNTQNAFAQKHKYAPAQNRNYTKTQSSNALKKSNRNTGSEELERIHVQIRKDLADKLIEMVYTRKREGKLAKRKASQRHIIEQALKEYFEKEGASHIHNNFTDT
jgi:hypothetical protein